MVRKAFLICGILSSLLYVAMNIIVAMQWQEYSSVSQTVSELSAVDAPTRPLWVGLAYFYTLLIIAFGCGIWMSADGSRSLRIAGAMILIYGIIGFFWPLAPMHQREVLAAGVHSLSDTLHLVFAGVTILLMFLAIGFTAAALGRAFRIYSIVSIIILLVFGGLTAIDAPHVQSNLPTPYAGVWERINIGVFLFWVIVLAVILLRKHIIASAGGGIRKAFYLFRSI